MRRFSDSRTYITKTVQVVPIRLPPKVSLLSWKYVLCSHHLETGGGHMNRPFEGQARRRDPCGGQLLNLMDTQVSAF